MTFQEKRLSHQIQPVTLFTVWRASLIVLPVRWRRRLALALLVSSVPSIAVPALLVRWANREPSKRSVFGDYMKRSMTSTRVAVRSGGYVVMALGAWYGRPVFLALGYLVIVFGWLQGGLKEH